MQIGLRRISSESVEWFKKSCLSGGPGRPSRSAMTRELCERENWRPGEADDLRKCLAFDATAAFRVWDPALLARERPDDPARLHVAQDDIDMVCALAAHRRLKVPRGPPGMDIWTFAALAAGQAEFHPSKRQPLPGTQKVWEGLKILWNAVIGH